MVAGLVARVVLVLAGVVAGRYGRPGALVLAAASLLWLLVNKPMEGPRLLIVFTETHGLAAGRSGGSDRTPASTRSCFVLPHGD